MKFAFLILVLITALGAVSCGGAGNASNSSEQPKDNSNSESVKGNEYVAPDAKGIQTMTVKTADVPNYLELAAHIEPDPTHVVHVFAPAGGRITELKVRPWQKVEKGQTLALLQSSDLARAMADFRKGLADNEVKQKQLARAQDLLNHHAIAEKDFQQALADADTAKAELEAAREQILVLGMDPNHPTSQLRVAAPRSGVVFDVGAAQGEFSKSLDAPTPLCTIADITTIWAVGDVYEKDLRAVKSGQE